MHHANVNACDNGGNTPLHHAAREGLITATELLLERPEIDCKIVNEQKESAVDCVKNNEIKQLIVDRRYEKQNIEKEMEQLRHINCFIDVSTVI